MEATQLTLEYPLPYAVRQNLISINLVSLEWQLLNLQSESSISSLQVLEVEVL
jgi:hypothetical protein